MSQEPQQLRACGQLPGVQAGGARRAGATQNRGAARDNGEKEKSLLPPTLGPQLGLCIRWAAGYQEKNEQGFMNMTITLSNQRGG